MGDSRTVFRVLTGKPNRKRPSGRPFRRWEDNTRMDQKEIGCNEVDWKELVQVRDRWCTFGTAATNVLVPNAVKNTTMERSYSVDPSQIQVDSLEMAGKMLEKQMTKDNSFPSLLDLTGILPEAQSSTLSGLSERDYPSASGVPGGLDNVRHLALYDKVFIPPEVVEHFGRIL
uniref:Uncharacterized protein n=1 Tax=Timema tahoe TaxID=61484 RepID=A0A7R9IDD5_9NEOP|nr:unnamed protein product [Timema tahoe]